MEDPGTGEPFETEQDLEPAPGRSKRTPLIAVGAVLVVAACCCLIGAVVLVWTDPFDWNLVARLTGRYDAAAEAMPADVDVYISLDLLQLQSPETERVVRAFAEVNPEIEPSTTEDLLSDLDEEMERELGITFSEDILPWVGQHAGVGIMNLDLSSTAGPEANFDFLFVAAVRNPSEAAVFADLFRTKMAENGEGPLQEEVYEGATIYSIGSDAGSDGVAFSLTRNVFIVSTEVASVRASIDAKRGESFMDSASFSDLAGSLPGGRTVTAYITQDVIMEAYRSAGVPSFSTAEVSAIASWQVGAVALSFVPAGIQIDTAAVFDPATLTDLQRDVFQAMAADTHIDNRLPSSTLIFLAGRRLDLTFELMNEQLATTGVGTDMEEAMRELADEIGFNPLEDLIPHLDGEYAFAVLPSRDGVLASDEFNIDLGIGLLFETSNPDALVPVIDSVDVLVSRGFGIGVDSVDVAGHSLHWVADPLFGEVLAYGLTEDLLLVTTSASTAEDLLLAEEPLSANAEYQSVMASFPGGMQPVLFVDLHSLLGVIREGLDPEDLEPFQEEVGLALGPIEYIAMANSLVDETMQRATLIVFITGGTE